MTQPVHIASDDALYFLNSSSSNGPDLFDASEDPNGKNGANHPQLKHNTSFPRRRTTATSLHPGMVTNLTPGAQRIP